MLNYLNTDLFVEIFCSKRGTLTVLILGGQLSAIVTLVIYPDLFGTAWDSSERAAV